MVTANKTQNSIRRPVMNSRQGRFGRCNGRRFNTRLRLTIPGGPCKFGDITRETAPIVQSRRERHSRVTGRTTAAQALWYIAPGQAEIRHETLAPVAQARGAVACARSSARISRGTEALVFAGRVPASEHRAHARAASWRATFPFPVKYGYATVGASRTGRRICAGETVFALHPHQSLFNISGRAALSSSPTASRRSAPCWRQTWRPRSTRSGMRRRARPTGSQSSAPAWSARWSPFFAASLPGADVTLVDINTGRAGN